MNVEEIVRPFRSVPSIRIEPNPDDVDISRQSGQGLAGLELVTVSRSGERYMLSYTAMHEAAASTFQKPNSNPVISDMRAQVPAEPLLGELVMIDATGTLQEVEAAATYIADAFKRPATRPYNPGIRHNIST